MYSDLERNCCFDRLLADLGKKGGVCWERRGGGSKLVGQGATKTQMLGCHSERLGEGGGASGGRRGAQEAAEKKQRKKPLHRLPMLTLRNFSVFPQCSFPEESVRDGSLALATSH